MLTIGVALLVAFGWMLGLLAGAVAGRSNPPHPEPLPTSPLNKGEGSTSEQSLSGILQKTKDDIGVRTQLVRQQWDSAMAQLKQQQTFAQYVKESINNSK